jgi:hypothetical protein
MTAIPEKDFYDRRSGSAVIYIPARTNSVYNLWGGGMWQYRKKPLSWVFVSRMIGIICFLIIVVLANILTYYITNSFFNSGVTFLNDNFPLLIIIAVVLLVADISDAFSFPFNLPAPLIRAIGSVFFILFILRVIQFVDENASTNLYTPSWYLAFLIVPLIFLIVLVTGYYSILRQLWWQPKTKSEEGNDTIIVPDYPRYQAAQPVTDAKSWEEIGIEFRLMLYDIIHRFREDIRKKN